MRIRRLSSGVLLGGLALGPLQPAASEPAGLVVSLQRHYQTVRDFSADFTHTYEGGFLRKRTTEAGRLLVRKPGRMRWTYTGPEPKVFVADGRMLYSYLPADKQVYVSRLPAAGEMPTPALFLAGQGDLIRDFTAAEPGLELPTDVVGVRLTPRRAEPDFDWLVLGVERGSLRLRLLVSVDGQGGRSTFRFSNLKENVGVPDREFTFHIPPGVEVITGERTAR